MLRALFLLSMLLIGFTQFVHAETVPYWGDPSCENIEQGCDGGFPKLWVRFFNPITEKSRISWLSFTSSYTAVDLSRKCRISSRNLQKLSSKRQTAGNRKMVARLTGEE